MVSGVEESLGRHFEAIHFALEFNDVRSKVRVLVSFLQISSVDISLRWTRELKQMDGVFVVVNDHNVWLQWSHTDLRGD